MAQGMRRNNLQYAKVGAQRQGQVSGTGLSVRS